MSRGDRVVAITPHESRSARRHGQILDPHLAALADT